MVLISIRVGFGELFRKNVNTRVTPPDIGVFFDGEFIGNALNSRDPFNRIDETFDVETEFGNHTVRAIIGKTGGCGGGSLEVISEGRQIAFAPKNSLTLNPCGNNTAALNFTLLQEPPQLELIELDEFQLEPIIEEPFIEPVIIPAEQQNGINLRNIAIIGVILLLI